MRQKTGTEAQEVLNFHSASGLTSAGNGLDGT
jgi:hypothetical protein